MMEEIVLNGIAFNLTTYGLAFSTIGAFVLARPYFSSEKAINEMARTKWSGNPELAKYFRQQKKQGAYGIALLFIGFLLQFLAAV